MFLTVPIILRQNHKAHIINVGLFVDKSNPHWAPQSMNSTYAKPEESASCKPNAYTDALLLSILLGAADIVHKFEGIFGYFGGHHKRTVVFWDLYLGPPI